MKKFNKAKLLIPLAFAVPLGVALIYAYYRYAATIANLLDVAVKSVVKQG